MVQVHGIILIFFFSRKSCSCQYKSYFFTVPNRNAYFILICIHVNDVSILYEAQIQALVLTVKIGLITDIISSKKKRSAFV